jgi:hypothetical protein
MIEIDTNNIAPTIETMIITRDTEDGGWHLFWVEK